MLKQCCDSGQVQWKSNWGTILSRGDGVRALKEDLLSVRHREVFTLHRSRSRQTELTRGHSISGLDKGSLTGIVQTFCPPSPSP